MFSDSAFGYVGVGGGVFRIGAAGKTTFPNFLLHWVVMVSTMRHTSKKDDISKVVGLLGCEMRTVVYSFLMVPRSRITLCLGYE